MTQFIIVQGLNFSFILGLGFRLGPGEMALAILPEDPGFSAPTFQLTIVCNLNSRTSDTLSCLQQIQTKHPPELKKNF